MEWTVRFRHNSGLTLLSVVAFISIFNNVLGVIMTWHDVLQIVISSVLMIAGLFVLHIFAYVQVTCDMTPEEKREFDNYVIKNGLHSRDPWDF